MAASPSLPGGVGAITTGLVEFKCEHMGAPYVAEAEALTLCKLKLRFIHLILGSRRRLSLSGSLCGGGGSSSMALVLWLSLLGHDGETGEGGLRCGGHRSWDDGLKWQH